MTYLAHFCGIEKLELILESMSLRFGCLDNTNDPYENRNIFFTYRIPTSNGGRLSTLSDYYYENEKTKDKFYVLCFSNREDSSELINKPRMWSQYANNHNGCCIILRKEPFDLTFSKLRYKKADSSTIDYDLNQSRNEINSLSHQLSRFVDQKTSLEKIRNFLWENRRIYLFKKMRDWKEESEYRYCIYSSKVNDKIHIDISEAIERVVLGDKVSNFLRNAILDYCYKKEILVSQVYWNNGYPVLQSVKDLVDTEKRNKLLNEDDLKI